LAEPTTTDPLALLDASGFELLELDELELLLLHAATAATAMAATASVMQNRLASAGLLGPHEGSMQGSGQRPQRVFA
jgi:hypothetical protein